jgi:hypothetical protein
MKRFLLAVTALLSIGFDAWACDWATGSIVSAPCNVESTGTNKIALDTGYGYIWLSNPTAPNSYQGANYDRLGFGFSSNVATITTQGAGTGTIRPIQIAPQGTNGLFLDTAGRLGVNTTSPAAQLEVAGLGGTSKLAFDSNANFFFISNQTAPNSYQGVNYDRIGVGYSGNVAYLRTDASGSGTTRPLQITTGGNNGIYVATSGNVGINTTSPSAALSVSGNITATGSITGASVIGAVYQDLAEWVPATSDMEPGTVVVLNPAKSNEVMPSVRKYDTTVAGVVSGQPGILLGVASTSKAKIATTGRVKVHADASDAPIRIGDLLVTSGKAGVAMRSMPLTLGGVDIHRPGTVIGKALEPLAGGQGEILVLLSLQ